MFESKILGSVTADQVAMGPIGFGSGFDAGYRRAISLDNSNARRRTLLERYDGLIEEYGLDAENPYRHGSYGDLPQVGHPRNRFTPEETRLGGFWAQVEKARERGVEVPKREDFEQEIARDLLSVEEEASRLYGAGTGSALGTFTGEAAGSLSDPVNIALAPIGAGAGFGLVKTALTEFVVGAAAELFIAEDRTAWYEELGMEAPDPLLAAAASGVASATLGTLPLALQRAVRAGRMSLGYAQRVHQRIEAMGPEDVQRFVESQGVELKPVEALALRSAMLDTWQADALGMDAAEAAATVRATLDEFDREGVYAAPDSAPLPRDPGAIDRTTGTATARMAPQPQSVDDLVTAFIPRVIQQESGGRVDARNPNSSAYGLGQFTAETWRDVRRENPDLGLPANRRNATADQQRAALRRWTARNTEILQDRLGRLPTQGELYAMHFFGRGIGPEVVRAEGSTLLRDLYPRRSTWTEVRDANGFPETMTVQSWRRRYTRRFRDGSRVTTAGEQPRGGPTADAQGRPYSLTAWLKRQGGLVENETLMGDLAALELRRMRPGLISREGLDLDRAAGMAADEGFIERADPDLLVEAIRDEVAGRRRVVAQDQVGRELFDQETAARTEELTRLDERIAALRDDARVADIEADDVQIEEALELAEVEGREPLDVLDDIVERDVIRDIDGEVEVADVAPFVRGGPISRDVADVVERRAAGDAGATDRGAVAGAGRAGAGAGTAAARAEGLAPPANEDIPFFDSAAVQRPIEPGDATAEQHAARLLTEIEGLPDDAQVLIGMRIDENGEAVPETVTVGELRRELEADSEFLEALGVCSRVS